MRSGWERFHRGLQLPHGDDHMMVVLLLPFTQSPSNQYGLRRAVGSLPLDAAGNDVPARHTRCARYSSGSGRADDEFPTIRHGQHQLQHIRRPKAPHPPFSPDGVNLMLNALTISPPRGLDVFLQETFASGVPRIATVARNQQHS